MFYKMSPKGLKFTCLQNEIVQNVNSGKKKNFRKMIGSNIVNSKSGALSEFYFTEPHVL